MLRDVQERLLAIEKPLSRDSPVEVQRANRIANDRFQALTALIYLGGLRSSGSAGTGHKYAKEILLRVTGGAPLTLCTGDVSRLRHGKRKAVSTSAGDFPLAVKGCLAVIPEDTRNTGGEMWVGLCPRCRNKARRGQERWLVRRIKHLVEGRGAKTIYAYRTLSSDNPAASSRISSME